jgi:hypothetical protein
MPVDLKALIAKTEGALQRETDPGQLRVLEARLGTLQARAEMSDDDDDDDKKKKSDDDDGDEDSKSAKHAARAKKLEAKSKATGLRAKAAELKSKAAEHEEEAKRCEEEADDGEGGEEAAASLPGMTPGAVAALTSSTALMPEAMRRIEALERDAAARQKTAMIEEARAGRKITPAEYKALVGKPVSFVKDFLSMRPNAIVNVDDSALEIPDVSMTAGDVPTSVKSMVEAAVQSLGLKGEKADAHREKQYAAFRAGFAGKAVTH